MTRLSFHGLISSCMVLILIAEASGFIYDGPTISATPSGTSVGGDIVRVASVQLHTENSVDLERDLQNMALFVKRNAVDVLVLPEMMFHPWFDSYGQTLPPDAVWNAAVEAHEDGIPSLSERVGSDVVLIGSRPIWGAYDATLGRRTRYNEGFIFVNGNLTQAHLKHYLPEEPGWYEDSWFDRGPVQFDAYNVLTRTGSSLNVGYAICTELFFGGPTGRGFDYGRMNVDLVVNPRSTGAEDLWTLGGQFMSAVTGAYTVSSNRVGGPIMRGRAFAAGPGGELIRDTNESDPFIAFDLDLSQSSAGKVAYPVYVTL